MLLGGCFGYFFILTLGKGPNLTSIFFNLVETNGLFRFWWQVVDLVYKRYILPIGWLCPPDPALYKNLKNPLIETTTYLEPNWPLFLKVNPPKQGLFNQNKGHLGSREVNLGECILCTAQVGFSSMTPSHAIRTASWSWRISLRHPGHANHQRGCWGHSEVIENWTKWKMIVYNYIYS